MFSAMYHLEQYHRTATEKLAYVRKKQSVTDHDNFSVFCWI